MRPMKYRTKKLDTHRPWEGRKLSNFRLESLPLKLKRLDLAVVVLLVEIILVEHEITNPFDEGNYHCQSWNDERADQVG